MLISMPIGLTLPMNLLSRLSMARREASEWRRILAMSIMIISLAGANDAYATDMQTEHPPQPDQLSNNELLKRIETLEMELRDLKQAQKPTTAATTARPDPPTAQASPSGPSPSADNNKDLFGLYPSPIQGLKFGAYGEVKFGSLQNPSANGQWQNGFDGGRLVLLPSYQITKNISFEAEIEFEHGGIASDPDDKLNGAVEIEQAFMDFKVRPWVNFHSPGIDLVPIGYTNLVHEPTTFYSVQRPELARGLIPTTFFVPSWGEAYGQITDNLGYQFQVSNSAEDYGNGPGTHTGAGTVPNGPYPAGINGQDALGLSRPPVGSFAQLNNAFAYATRLNYTPTLIPGLAGSTSVYFSPNIEPRGAHSDLGTPLGNASLTIVDSEFRYHVPKTGWEFRGEYAQAFFGSPGNMRANNDGDPTNNIGNSMYGLSAEIAYHFPLGAIIGSEWEAVPFYRYTYENLQTSGFKGTDANTLNGSGQLQFHDIGVAVFPSPQLVLKANYTHVQDRQPGGARSDSILGGVGFFF